MTLSMKKVIKIIIFRLRLVNLGKLNYELSVTSAIHLLTITETIYVTLVVPLMAFSTFVSLE